MKPTLRPARKDDVAALLQVYDSFIRGYVGCAARAQKNFQRMLNRKDNVVYVATDSENKVVGYVYARVNKRFDRGEFEEIIVDPSRDFVNTAKPLVEKVNAIFVKKHVSSIAVGSLRNPAYERVFSELGFSEYESLGVFMYSVLNVQKFLSELSPVFISRLQRFKQWNGTVQLDCEGHSIFLQKSDDSVQPIVWTNQLVDFKVSLPVALLTKLIFGIVDANEAYRAGELRTEHTIGEAAAGKMLKTLFPKRQFLILDSW